MRKDTDLISQIEATKNSYERMVKRRDQGFSLLGHDFGIHEVNLAIGGLVRGKVTTIAARSSIGKTSMVIPMMEAAKRVINGRRVELFFASWESLEDYMVDRYVCMKLGITNQQLTMGAPLFTNEYMKKLDEAYRDAADLPITYQTISADISKLQVLFTRFTEECAEKSKIEGVGVLPVLVVDYIGIAKFSGRSNRTYQIGEFMMGVKQLMNSTGGAAVLLAQINRSADERDEPVKSDLSDSQSIEQNSDNLIILHRPEHNGIEAVYNPQTGELEDSKDRMILKVEKARDFGTGRRIVVSKVRFNRFHSINHDWDYDYWNLYSDEEFWKQHFQLK